MLCILVSGSFVLSACKNKATELNSNMIILTEKEYVYTGQEIKPNVSVKVGDKILFAKYSGSEFKLDGQEYIVLKQTDILAVLED